MTEREEMELALNGLIKDLQVFVELSFQEDDLSIQEWVKETINKIDSHCWERQQCKQTSCPAYRNECGRCWLLAGTMCGGKVQGKFAEKYGSCIQCDVYQENIGSNRVQQLRELVIVLIHSLRLREQELAEARSEIKILSGFLPICAACKKIRDDQGNWNAIETYIRDHSEAEFSHGICPDCIEKLYPGLMKK